MLPGLSFPRVPVMKLQNFSISTTRSTARRTASAFVPAPSAFRARAIALGSTKNDFRVYRMGLIAVFRIGICYATDRHTSSRAKPGSTLYSR